MLSYRRSQQYVYTVLTIVFLGIVYELIVQFLIRPFIPEDNVWYRIAFGGLGLLLLIVFAGTQAIIRRVLRHTLFGVSSPREHIEERLVTVFAQESNPQELCAHVATLITTSLGFDRVRIVLRREAQQFVELTEPHPNSSDLSVVREYCTGNSQVLTVNDVLFNEQMNTYMRSRDVVCIVPFVVDEKLIGWFECMGRNTYLLKDSAQVLERLRPLLSIAFHRVMLDLKFKERIEQLITLNRISQTMNSSLNVKETLEAVMDSVVDLLHVDRALMYLIDDSGSYFAPRIGRGMTDEVRLDFKVDVQKSIFAHIMKYRQPLIVEDVFHDPRVNQEYAKYVQTKSFVAVPIVSKEKVIGIIGVDNLLSGRPVKEVNTELLVTLANDAAIALTNSRLYEEVQGFNQVLQEKIDEATKHLLALLEMKSHFLTVASHQLRTPTTIIKGMLSMIVEDPDLPQEKVREFVGHAYTSTGRLERIVNELLSATELEDPHIVPTIETVDLSVLVQAVVKHLQPLAAQRGDTLTMHLPETLVSIETDKFKLQEALSNIVDNAIRYTKDGTVDVSLSTQGSDVCIEVRDTGIGISSADRAIIFEKFRRGSQGIAMDPNGTGLGLYIVERIIQMIHGSITLTSEGKDKGSVCTIRLSKTFVSSEE